MHARFYACLCWFPFLMLGRATLEVQDAVAVKMDLSAFYCGISRLWSAYFVIFVIIDTHLLFLQVRTANEDYEHYDTSKSNGSNGSESTEETKTETKGNYQRTLSGGLRNGTAEVAKKAILQRIDSKKAVSSYQLGRQLSLNWTTGAGPRIGCIADYPVELREQALEFVNFSPSEPPTPTVSQCSQLLPRKPPTPSPSR